MAMVSYCASCGQKIIGEPLVHQGKAFHLPCHPLAVVRNKQKKMRKPKPYGGASLSLYHSWYGPAREVRDAKA